jgi:hypothetical protein
LEEQVNSIPSSFHPLVTVGQVGHRAIAIADGEVVSFQRHERL